MKWEIYGILIVFQIAIFLKIYIFRNGTISEIWWFEIVKFGKFLEFSGCEFLGFIV